PTLFPSPTLFRSLPDRAQLLGEALHVGLRLALPLRGRDLPAGGAPLRLGFLPRGPLPVPFGGWLGFRRRGGLARLGPAGRGDRLFCHPGAFLSLLGHRLPSTEHRRTAAAPRKRAPQDPS